jgi:cysteinyl-tRNA synthetase
VVFDLLTRVLRLEYKLLFARNITDVDDKINAEASKKNIPIEAITSKYIQAYNEDMSQLGVGMPDIEPRATQNISEMVSMIETLIEKGHAYVSENHPTVDCHTEKLKIWKLAQELKLLLIRNLLLISCYGNHPQKIFQVGIHPGEGVDQVGI